MGYTADGRRRSPQQKTIKPPTDLTPKQTETWLQEQARLFEISCKKRNPTIDLSIILEKYTEIWLQTIAPDKLVKSILIREKQDIERFKPYLGSYKLIALTRNASAVSMQNCANKRIRQPETGSPKRR